MYEKLLEIGLTNREAQAYQALFNHTAATVSQLAKEVHEHRTNLYDSLNSLLKKGLITYSIKNNIHYYHPGDPEKLVDYLKEKEKIAEQIKQELQTKKPHTLPTVEVHEGKEGFKTILRLMLREEKTIYGIGASEEWEKQFPIKIQQYMKEREKKQIKAKLLYTQKTKPIQHPLNQNRYLPSHLQQPSTIAIFGDYVAIFMWTEPLIATVTRSRKLSDSFREYFEALWKSAKAV